MITASSTRLLARTGKKHAITRCYSRPTFAPKPAIDIKHIRLSPGLYEQNCVSRNYPHLARNSWDILDLHNEWIALQQSARSVREQSNAVRRQLANAASSPDSSSRSSLLDEARIHKTKLDDISNQEAAIESKIEELALPLPNLSSHFTPDGSEPQVLDYINAHPDDWVGPSSSKSHVDIGVELGLLDFVAAGQTSGWGWYYLLGEAVALENALVQYALSVARRKGWQLVSPPSIIYSHIASACGFQPRDANGETQVYALAQAEDEKRKPELCLAGTAEIPFAGMKIGTTLDESQLPLKIIGASRCYRAEAGARGVDTKGLYRVHEFTKVEMFAWTAPDVNTSTGDYFAPASNDGDESTAQQKVFDEILSIQREIITGLGLHARILEMPSTDLGASAQRKVDIEVFFPSRRERDQGWGEVSSLSMCGDYQTRRLGTRMKRKIGGGSGKLEWPCTVNGTAMAIPRVLAAILENGWDENAKAVKIPEVLRPYMDGLTGIRRPS